MAESRLNPNLESSKASIPSNEELINSLVSGLEDCVVDSDSDKASNCEVNESSNKSDNSSVLNNCEPKTDHISENEEEKEVIDECVQDSNIPTSEDDLVDELRMKDLELTYSAEDKERLRQEADDLKLRGNNLFKSGEHRESALAYTQALRTCPLSFSKERAILYSNRAAAKMKMELNESAIEDCSKALELDEGYVKALFRRAQLYEATEKLDEALADYNKILILEPLHKEALYAAKRLPDQIQERNEKLKEEMMGKLKELGNMFLKPFGLSTENFQLNQDPNSGGYSVNFKS